MKLAIICYNHFDATISLASYLAAIYPETKINLFFILSKSYPSIEIIDLKNKKSDLGFVKEEHLPQVVDQEIFDYLGPEIKLNVFIFNKLNLMDSTNFRLLFDLSKQISAQKYDLLHFVGNSHWIVLLNYFSRGVPKVHTLHEPYPFVKVPLYRLFRHIGKINLLIRTGAHIIVPSFISFKRFISNFTPKDKKLTIIPFGPFEIYKKYIKGHVEKKENLLLYYGNISPYKGVDVLVRAMKKVCKINPDIELIIAGSGELPFQPEEMPSCITLINKHLDNEEIAALNQKASVIVCPYTSASQSGVVMTSFAFGNPVLATNVGALPEAIEHEKTGIIIEPGDVESLSEAILHLFSDSSVIENLRRNIREKYENPEESWEGIVNQTFCLYKAEMEKLKLNSISL